MATTAELKNHVQRVASLNTADTAEGVLVERWLNEAYKRALAQTGQLIGLKYLTATTDTEYIYRTDYNTPGTYDSGVAGVKSIASDTGGALERTSLDRILDLRARQPLSSTAEPTMFCALPNDDIELYPALKQGSGITIQVELLPLTLVTTTPDPEFEENEPTQLPVQFHYDLLANFALARAFEYRGDLTRAGYFHNAAGSAMSELQQWISEQGGIMGPRVRVVRRVQTIVKQPGQL